MKILLLDIETSPNLALVWGLFKENIPLDRLVASGKVICWSAKWYGERKIHFDSIYASSEKRMLRGIHRLLDEADAVVHYNGSSFDIPTLNKEFVQLQWAPPTPYKQIDLLYTVRKRFRFPSRKLDYVAKALKIPTKVRHTGFQMWLDCMAKKADAWREMEKYNRQDVVVLEALYERLKPWIASHPNHGTFEGVDCCPTCGSTHFHRRGYAMTQAYRYPRFQCRECGGWFRGAKSEKQEGRSERFRPVAD